MKVAILVVTITSIVAAIVIGAIVLIRQQAKKRREALQKIADEMGLDYSESQDDSILDKMQVFGLFNSGHSRRMINVIQGETEVARLAIFDYYFTTGGGQSTTTHWNTVLSMESTTLQIPAFSIRPESWFDRIGSALGFQDIDFQDHPDFSDSFVLKGKDEEAIRQFFDHELLDFFANHKGICIETVSGVLIYYRGGIRPEAMLDHVKTGYAIYSALVDRTSRS